GWNLPTKVTYSNQVCLYMGLRIQTDLIPWSLGWGGGPVNPLLKQSFEANDIRMKGSIIDVTDPEEGNVSTDYVWNSNQCMHETGLWNKKYTSLQMRLSNGSIGGIFLDMIPSTPNNGQLWNLQDEILLRFADVLLMAAELQLGNSKAQEYLDRVRARVGLPSVPATLENIKKERRHELAFEGLRYFDLLRWHDAEAAFAEIQDIDVQNSGVPQKYNGVFRPETGGFLPIPETEIRLSNGVLKQNPGW
ncbi:MAG: RagB/SusD family nutrient uptake outer membrane protein, partial [Bacteroidales bacterium]|nr:RagB/SusD family nutrient uptake outer membrane protein [Bacteroidales bacterium]